jgi:hypothetical protein
LRGIGSLQERPGHTRRCATVASFRTWRGSRPHVVPTTSSSKTVTTTERVGFEPTIPFQIYTRSRRAPSTARPPLHETLSGERRIRTYDTVPGMPDFESGAFDHSASSPIFTCRVSSRAVARRNPSTSGGSRPPIHHSSPGAGGCAGAPRRGCRENPRLPLWGPSCRTPDV